MSILTLVIVTNESIQSTCVHALLWSYRTLLFLVILNHDNGLLIHFDPDQLLLYVVIYLPNPFILQFLPALIHSSPYIGFKFVLPGWLKIAIQSENLVTSFEWWSHSGHFLYSHWSARDSTTNKVLSATTEISTSLKILCKSIDLPFSILLAKFTED